MKIFEETFQGLKSMNDDKLNMLKKDHRNLYWFIVYILYRGFILHNDVPLHQSWKDHDIRYIVPLHQSWKDHDIRPKDFSLTDFIKFCELLNTPCWVMELRSTLLIRELPLKLDKKGFNTYCRRLVASIIHFIISGFKNEKNKFNILYFEQFFGLFSNIHNDYGLEVLDYYHSNYRFNMFKFYRDVSDNWYSAIDREIDRNSVKLNNDVKDQKAELVDNNYLNYIRDYLEKLSNGTIDRHIASENIEQLVDLTNDFETLTPLVFLIRSESNNEHCCIFLANLLINYESMRLYEACFSIYIGSYYGYWGLVECLIRYICKPDDSRIHCDSVDTRTIQLILVELFSLALEYEWELSSSIIDVAKDNILTPCPSFIPYSFLQYIVRKRDLKILKNIHEHFKHNGLGFKDFFEIQIDETIITIADSNFGRYFLPAMMKKLIIPLDDFCTDNKEDVMFWLYIIKKIGISNINDDIIDKALTKTNLKIFQALVLKKIEDGKNRCIYLKKAIHNNRLDIVEWLVKEYPFLLTTRDKKKDDTIRECLYQ